MRLVRTELVDSREILPGQWLQSFQAPALATGSRAGQFVHVRTGDLSGLVLRRPFEVNSRSSHLLLVAGGLGMAGVRYLADEAIRDGRQVTLLFGAASVRDVYPSSLLPDEVEYVIATDDGSVGHHGPVTDLLQAVDRFGVLPETDN